MYRNHEHYPDPTAGRALGSLRRKENQLNTGKQFEADWKSSMPKDAWCYRLKDSAATYYGGNENLSFSIDNICDFDVYRYPMHHYFELKTIETPSIPLEKILGRFDRERQKYHKLKHITDMAHVANAFQNVWAGVEDFMSCLFEGLMRIVAAGIEGFIILINGLIAAYNSVAWLYGGTIDYISNPAWDYANKIAADRKARQEARKKQQEAANNPGSPSSSGTSGTSQKVIESMTDTSKTTRADGSTVTTKVLTEKLQDETGKITQRVTKTVTEAGTKLVDGVERSYKTVTTYVDGIQTKVERSLDDITKTSSSTGSTTPTAPTPDKDLTDAVEANTEALLAANSKLAEMVRQANSLVLSDNMAITRSVAASGTAQVAAAANQYHREGDTNITQNIYSKAQTAADLQREARWEADRAKAQKR